MLLLFARRLANSKRPSTLLYRRVGGNEKKKRTDRLSPIRRLNAELIHRRADASAPRAHTRAPFCPSRTIPPRELRRDTRGEFVGVE